MTSLDMGQRSSLLMKMMKQENLAKSITMMLLLIGNLFLLSLSFFFV